MPTWRSFRFQGTQQFWAFVGNVLMISQICWLIFPYFSIRQSCHQIHRRVQIESPLEKAGGQKLLWRSFLSWIPFSSKVRFWAWPGWKWSWFIGDHWSQCIILHQTSLWTSIMILTGHPVVVLTASPVESTGWTKFTAGRGRWPDIDSTLGESIEVDSSGCLKLWSSASEKGAFPQIQQGVIHPELTFSDCLSYYFWVHFSTLPWVSHQYPIYIPSMPQNIFHS